MKSLLLTLILLPVSSLASASEFDPKSCSQIKSVEINLKPSIHQNDITFSNPELNIKLSESGYWVNDESVLIKDPSNYYQQVKSFFETSREFTQTLNSMGVDYGAYQKMSAEDWKKAASGKNGQQFYKQSVSMCKVILNLHQANHESLQLDQNFVAGINIELRGL